ncbi:hypothetical protein EJ654_30000 [Pseudomonas aeruginosa]|nr:hypothetical protein EJ654_30000 [Pseudomonas aeruginosa]RTC36947.1 hypothetical protein EJ705_20915 [Pseudomonas aeruginosa]HEJ5436221.1 hypothetical protein [Pseudomonas aeruginosa]
MIRHTEVRSGVEVQMTLPYERTRSVVQAQEFLVELSRDTTLSESIRNEARRRLCHYPSKGDMLQAGRNEEQAAGSIFEPVFSSSIED